MLSQLLGLLSLELRAGECRDAGIDEMVNELIQAIGSTEGKIGVQSRLKTGRCGTLRPRPEMRHVPDRHRDS